MKYVFDAASTLTRLSWKKDVCVAQHTVRALSACNTCQDGVHQHLRLSGCLAVKQREKLWAYFKEMSGKCWSRDKKHMMKYFSVKIQGFFFLLRIIAWRRSALIIFYIYISKRQCAADLVFKENNPRTFGCVSSVTVLCRHLPILNELPSKLYAHFSEF